MRLTLINKKVFILIPQVYLFHDNPEVIFVLLKHVQKTIFALALVRYIRLITSSFFSITSEKMNNFELNSISDYTKNRCPIFPVTCLSLESSLHH